MPTLALDTEDTGADFYHGARPFLVTTCDEDGEQLCWEWDVDPLTREPRIPRGDVVDLRDLLRRQASWQSFDQDTAARHRLVTQNGKFDASALEAVGVDPWPWAAMEDTLIAGHVLASNQPHNLTDMALHYLGADILPHEEKLRDAVMVGRRLVQQARLRLKRGKTGEDEEPLAAWRIAEEGATDMPSAKGGRKDRRGTETGNLWKLDTWLPRALWRTVPGVRDEHPDWESVLRDYANVDSAITLALWQHMKGRLQAGGGRLWRQYRARMEVLRVARAIEHRGPTLSGDRLDEMSTEFRSESERLAAVCVNIADSYGYDLTLPKSGNNRSLKEFCFGVPEDGDHPLFPAKKQYLDLPITHRTETGEPSRDSKNAIPLWLVELPPTGKPRLFVKTLAAKRACDTAISYLEGYRRFWLPVDGRPGWWCLHPGLNPTGTDTLRWSHRNPNSSNISKKEDFNLRRCFGPMPGREWWSLDFRNLERRIPAYEAGEAAIISLLERPGDPPYYGSEHALVAHILYPMEFDDCRDDRGEPSGEVFKKRYKSTLYQWTKNFNFALQYGCQEKKGDDTARLKGAWRRVKSRFSAQEGLNQAQVSFANKHGYVETIPDREVDPRHGYPIMVTRTSYGRVEPTKPLSYHVQGTACWIVERAMVRCHDALDRWRAAYGFDGYLVLTVHDELAFDFPVGSDPEPWRDNLWRVAEMSRLMEYSGECVGIPTPTSVEYHAVSYAEGKSVDLAALLGADWKEKSRERWTVQPDPADQTGEDRGRVNCEGRRVRAGR